MRRRNLRAGKLALNRSIVIAAAAAALPTMLCPVHAGAANLTWDNNGATAPNPQDGAGSWDNTLLNFFNGTTNVAWINANNDTAVFGAGGTVGGAVGVAPGITIGGLTLNTNSYSFTGGSFVMANPTQITLNAGIGTINTPITGAGLITYNVSPTSNLVLTGTNTYTGTATFTGGGTVSVPGLAILNSTGAFVLSGATLNYSSAPAALNTITNTITIADTTTNNILFPSSSGTFSGVWSGGGTVNFASAQLYTFNQAASSSFSGTITLGASAGIRFAQTTANFGFPNGHIDLGTGAGSLQNRSNTGTIGIGALFGGPNTALAGGFNSTTGGIITYQIGGAGIDSTFNGTVRDGTDATKPTSLDKIGNDILTLNGTGTYTGPTTVTGGTLSLGNALAMSKSVSVFVNNAGSGALNVTGISAGYTIPSGQAIRGDGGTIYGNVNVTNPTGVVGPGSGSTSTSSGALTFNNNLTLNGGSIQLDVNSGSSDLITVGGTLGLTSGDIFVNPNGNTGTYRVINYNTKTGSLSNIAVLFGGRVASGSGITDNGAGGLDLTVTGFLPSATLTWNSNSSSNWDLQTSPNWLSSTSPTDSFFSGDSVVFSDGAGTQTAITKVGLLTPGGMTVNSSTNNYTIAGSGSISGVTLTKTSGTSILTLSTDNNFTSALIGAGTVILGSANAISSTAANAINIGHGTVMIGSLTVANNINIFRDDAAIGVVSGNGTLSGVLNDQNTSDHPGNPQLSITNVVIPSGANLAFTPTTLGSNFSGTLNFGASQGAFRFTSATAVSTLGKLDLGTGDLTLNNRDATTTLAIGALAGGPSTTFQGAVSVNGATALTIGAANVDSIFSGSMTNGTAGAAAVLSLTKIGSGTLTMNGTSTYTGTTAISAGSLIVNGIHSGGGAYTVTSTLGGGGIISASVNATGATLAPGASGAVGTLTVGSLTLSNTNIQTDASSTVDRTVVLNSNGLSQTGNATFQINDSGGLNYGHYVLVDYSGAPLANVASFALSTATIGGKSVSLVNNTLNTSVDLVALNPSAVDGTFTANGGGSFGTNTNWTGTSVPSGLDVTANFTSATTPGTVNVASSQTLGFLSFTPGAGAYTLNGAGGITLDVSGGYSGILVASGNQTVGVPVALNDEAFFDVATGASLNMTGAISGSSPVTVTGGGVATFATNNSISGPVTISGGTLVVNGSGGLGDASATNTLILAGGALQAGGAITSPATRGVQLNAPTNIIDTNGNSVEIDGVITGVGALNKVGANMLTLTGINTYLGNTTITAGTLAVNSNAALGVASTSVTNTVSFAGGALRLTGTVSIPASRVLSIGASGGTIDTNGNIGTIASIIPGTNPLNINGNGTLNLTAANTFAGVLTVTGGTVGANTTSSLGSGVATNTVVLDGGTIKSLGTVTSPNTRTVQVNAGGGTIDTVATTVSFAGAFTGVGNLTKVGAGTLTMTGTNSYSGSTIVNAGTLIMSGLNSYGGATVVNGGTLNLTGPSTWSTTALASTQTATNGSVVNGGRLIFNYAGTVANDPATAVKTALTTGFNQGTRFSSSLIRTTNAVDNLHGLGWTDNATVVTVAYTYYGDADLSGTVNITDFNTLAANYGSTGATWQKGDFNYDGVVNLLDLNSIATNFGATPALEALPSATPLGALVPEPASIGLIALGAGLMTRRRRK